MRLDLDIIKRAIICSGLVWLLVGEVSAATPPEMPTVPKAIKGAGIIRIGVKCDSPPFGSSMGNGQPVGIEVDMAKEIGKFAFGSVDKAELTCVTSDARIPALQAGRIDLVLATLGKNPARAEVIDFSDPYFWGVSTVMVPQASPIKSLADLSGKTVVITKGASQVKWFRENKKDVQIMLLNSASDSVQALKQGRVDAYAADGGVIAMLASNYPEMRVLPDGIDPGVNAIGLRKNEPELKAFVNAVLKKLRENGFYDNDVKLYVTNPAALSTTLDGFKKPLPLAH
jgi:polar amino acid transport system substrate-binding protein